MEAIYSEHNTSTNSEPSLTKKTNTSMNSLSRAPLSSINANANRSLMDVKKRGIRKTSSSFSLSSSNSKASLSSPSLSCSSSMSDQRQAAESESIAEDDDQLYGFDKHEIAGIFRRANDTRFPALRRADLIHDTPYLNAREYRLNAREYRQQSSKAVQFLDEHRVNSTNLMSLYRPADDQANRNKTSETSAFLQDPDENFFTKEMAMMMTLTLASPIDGSDSESDQLSVGDDYQ